MCGDDCSGILGRIFGHKFKSFLTLYTPARGLKQIGDARNILKRIDAMADKEFTVICKRCGEKK